MREDLEKSLVIGTFYDEDNAIVLWSAKNTNECIYGQSLDELSSEVSVDLVKDSILNLYLDLSLSAEGDQINTILTLCGMYYTLQTDCIESKDVAGMLAKDDLREEYYEIIDLAIRAYRDGIRVN